MVDDQPPAWPNPQGGKPFNLDLATEDLAAVEARLVELGAAAPDDHPWA